MTPELVLFYGLGALSLLSAIAAVGVARTLFGSAQSLGVTVLSLSGIYVLLHAELVAVAQPLRTRDAVRFGEIEFRFEMRSVPKLEAAGFDPKTQPKIVPSSETFIMRSGKSKSGRPRQLFNRAAPWVVLAALIAVLVIYFFLPDLADQIIAKLPAVIREPLQSLRN